MEKKNSTKHPSAYKVISIVVIVILAILFYLPIILIITGSFKTNATINSTTPIWWPKRVDTGELSEIIQPPDRTAVPVQYSIQRPDHRSVDLKQTLTGPTVPT